MDEESNLLKGQSLHQSQFDFAEQLEQANNARLADVDGMRARDLRLLRIALKSYGQTYMAAQSAIGAGGQNEGFYLASLRADTEELIKDILDGEAQREEATVSQVAHRQQEVRDHLKTVRSTEADYARAVRHCLQAEQVFMAQIVPAAARLRKPASSWILALTLLHTGFPSVSM